MFEKILYGFSVAFESLLDGLRFLEGEILFTVASLELLGSLLRLVVHLLDLFGFMLFHVLFAYLSRLLLGLFLLALLCLPLQLLNDCLLLLFKLLLGLNCLSDWVYFPSILFRFLLSFFFMLCFPLCLSPPLCPSSPYLASSYPTAPSASSCVPLAFSSLKPYSAGLTSPSASFPLSACWELSFEA